VWIAALLVHLSGATMAVGETVDHPLGYELGRCAGTDSKPQSKLWYQDGSWWCVLATPDGNRIHELVAHRWIALETPDALLADADHRADVLWDGTKLIVLLFGSSPQLFEFTYNASTRSYSRLAGFPVSLTIPAASETAVVDQDSQGRLWITWTADRQVRVAHSSPDHLQWNFPGTLLRDQVSDHDVSTVVAFGGNAMGVFWSDQARQEFAFRMRDDRDAPDAWKPVETVHAGERVADDHVNACVDASGRIYVVTKNGAHELAAHRRDERGTWTTQVDILQGGHGTRPILMLSEDDTQLHLLYSRWHDGLEIIAHRQAPLGTLDFGAAQPFLVLLGEDIRVKDVTGTKQTLPTGTLVAVAHAVNRAWWQGWGQGITSELARAASQPLTVSRIEQTPDAVLALSFDEGQGASVADATAMANLVSLGGEWVGDMSEPHWVAGVSGAALRFDGYRHFLTVADAPSLTPTGSFTIEAWVRRFGLWDNHVIVAKGVPGKRSYQLRIEEQNHIEFLRDVQGSKGKHRVRSATTIEDSLWHHIACVVDLQRLETRLYLDGVQVAATPDSGSGVQTDQPLYIGARVYKERLREWWPGEIDQVRLTPAVVYDADFVPATGFPTVGAAVFLSWASHYPGPVAAAAATSYEVFRQLPGAEFLPLLEQPTRRTQHRDIPPAAGLVTYRVRPQPANRHRPLDQSITWQSELASPTPSETDSSTVTSH
jgi:hypothetical protein